MKGVVLCAITIVAPSELKATAFPVPVGNVAGFAYLVPNPELLHGYTEMNGVVKWLTAIASPLGLNATPRPVVVGNVAGLAYLVPKPELLHEYTVT
jgi:hypothetical protein